MILESSIPIPNIILTILKGLILVKRRFSLIKPSRNLIIGVDKTTRTENYLQNPANVLHIVNMLIDI